MDAPRGRRAAWAALLRLPLAPTVAADLLAGAVAAGREPGAWLLPAFIASAALYTAGMVGNDLVDLPRDRRDRPERPLPSGRITAPRAARALAGLLALGLLLPCLTLPPAAAPAWILLAVCVAAYDLGPRGFPGWGPLWLGLCRGVDVLAGGLAAGGACPPAGHLLVVAALFGAYGAAVTIQAERETAAGPAARALRLLPAAPAALLGAWMADGRAAMPLVVLIAETLWRQWGPRTVLAARRSTGAWLRGFLLLGAAVAFWGQHSMAAAGLLLLWILATWSLAPGPQS